MPWGIRCGSGSSEIAVRWNGTPALLLGARERLVELARAQHLVDADARVVTAAPAGATATTRTPNGRARAARASPIRPSPTMSNVFPVSSPGSSGRSLSACSQRRASCARNSRGNPRVNIRIIASRCSAMFGPCTPLALVTATPRASSAGVATPSSPAATELSQRRRGARASWSSVRRPATTTSASGSARANASPQACASA